VQRFEKFVIGKRFRAFVDQASLHWLHNKELCSINKKEVRSIRVFEIVPIQPILSQGSRDERCRCVVLCSGGDSAGDWSCWRSEGNTLLGSVKRRNHGAAAPVQKKKKKKAVKAAKGEMGVAQVEMEGVWGFETKLLDVDALQADDDEVKLIRVI
jgi:hypothetical protein